MVQPIAGLAKSLRGNNAHAIGAVAQVGEERIEFRLNRAAQSGKQEGDEGGEGQAPVAGEELWRAPGRFKKTLRSQDVTKFDNDVTIFRNSYNSLINQYVETALCHIFARFAHEPTGYGGCLYCEDGAIAISLHTSFEPLAAIKYMNAAS